MVNKKSMLEVITIRSLKDIAEDKLINTEEELTNMWEWGAQILMGCRSHIWVADIEGRETAACF